MSSGIRELKLWQEAVGLAGEVVRLARVVTKRETKVLTDQLMTAASGVASRIASGYTHPSLHAQRALYVAARQSLMETETLLAVARHAGVLSTDAVLPLTARASTVHRLLGGYVAYVERQISDSSGARGAADDGAGGAGVPAVAASAG